MPDERLYTVQEAADKLGLKSTGRVRQIALDLGVGRLYGKRLRLFTEADIEVMRQRDTTRGPKPKGRAE